MQGKREQKKVKNEAREVSNLDLVRNAKCEKKARKQKENIRKPEPPITALPYLHNKLSSVFPSS